MQLMNHCLTVRCVCKGCRTTPSQANGHDALIHKSVQTKICNKLLEPRLTGSELHNDNIGSHPVSVLTAQSGIHRRGQEITTNYHGRLVCPHIIRVLIAQ